MFSRARQKRRMNSLRLLVILSVFVFSFSSIESSALTIEELPAATQLLSVTAPRTPPVLRGISVDPAQPLAIDFIFDAQEETLSEDQVKTEAQRLTKYFLAGLTIPEQDLWVNLSVFESDKVIPDDLAVTDLGKDLLGEDYILKQLLASLMHPDTKSGKEFWSKVYAHAEQLYGTVDLPLDTFNKIWIVPEKVVVYVSDTQAIIEESRLKVMLEGDYLAMKKSMDAGDDSALPEDQAASMNLEASRILKETILPLIEKEVNGGEHFAVLRQVFHSLVLASWYKEQLIDSIITQAYADQGKVSGIDIGDPQIRQKVFERYAQAYKEGLYNVVRTEYDETNKRSMMRRYVSGGIFMGTGSRRRAGRVVVPSFVPADLVPSLTAGTAGELEAIGVGGSAIEQVRLPAGELERRRNQYASRDQYSVRLNLFPVNEAGSNLPVTVSSVGSEVRVSAEQLLPQLGLNALDVNPEAVNAYFQTALIVPVATLGVDSRLFAVLPANADLLNGVLSTGWLPEQTFILSTPAQGVDIASTPDFKVLELDRDALRELLISSPLELDRSTQLIQTSSIIPLSALSPAAKSEIPVMAADLGVSLPEPARLESVLNAPVDTVVSNNAAISSLQQDLISKLAQASVGLSSSAITFKPLLESMAKSLAVTPVADLSVSPVISAGLDLIAPLFSSPLIAADLDATLLPAIRSDILAMQSVLPEFQPVASLITELSPTVDIGISLTAASPDTQIVYLQATLTSATLGPLATEFVPMTMSSSVTFDEELISQIGASVNNLLSPLGVPSSSVSTVKFAMADTLSSTVTLSQQQISSAIEQGAGFVPASIRILSEPQAAEELLRSLDTPFGGIDLDITSLIETRGEQRSLVFSTILFDLNEFAGFAGDVEVIKPPQAGAAVVPGG